MRRFVCEDYDLHLERYILTNYLESIGWCVLSFAAVKLFVLEHGLLVAGFAVLLLAFIVNELRAAKSGAKTLSPQQAVLLMNQESVPVIDVREAKAFLANHILESKNIPLATLSALTLTQFDSKQAVIVVAEVGAQTNSAVVKLKALHFSRILILENGLDAWKSAGFPTVKGVKK